MEENSILNDSKGEDVLKSVLDNEEKEKDSVLLDDISTIKMSTNKDAVENLENTNDESNKDLPNDSGDLSNKDALNCDENEIRNVDNCDTDIETGLTNNVNNQQANQVSNKDCESEENKDVSENCGMEESEEVELCTNKENKEVVEPPEDEESKQVSEPCENEESKEVLESCENEESKEVSEPYESVESEKMSEACENEESKKMSENPEREESKDVSERCGNEEINKISELCENEEGKKDTEHFENESKEVSENFDNEESKEISENFENEESKEVSENFESDKIIENMNVVDEKSQDVSVHTENCIELDEKTDDPTEKAIDESVSSLSKDVDNEILAVEELEKTNDKSESKNVDISMEVDELDKSVEQKDTVFEEDSEQTEFVQVNSKDKTSSVDSVDNQEEIVEQRNDEDPIGGAEATEGSDLDGETITADRRPEPTVDRSKDADEELCIIPDTEREISQAEKDAATAKKGSEKEKRDVVTSSDTDVGKSSEETVANGADSTTTSEECLQVVSEEVSGAVSPKTESRPMEVEDSENTKIGSSQDSAETPSITSSEAQAEGFELTISILDKPMEQTCSQCCLLRTCQYQFQQDGKDRFLCRDSCLRTFKTENQDKNTVVTKSSSLKFKMVRSKEEVESKEPPVFIRSCMECKKPISGFDRNLSWECMEFCNEDCIATYQNSIGSTCANCKNNVPLQSLGKYCVRFGSDIRQFCSSSCLEEFKKGLKVCSYCQKDISGGFEGFLAPVGDKGQFKDFCTQDCMEKYDQMSNNHLPADEIEQCDVCDNKKLVRIQVVSNDKLVKLCSEPCFVAFKFANNVEPEICDMCRRHFEATTYEYSFYFDEKLHHFCGKTCRNVFVMANRKIVPCQWCKVKKYNYDMIKKTVNNGSLMVCSINCFALYQVSVNAVSSRKIKCDNCGTLHLAQYHLTMSDATVRNFCSYQCVMTFQNRYSKTPITITGPGTPAASEKTSAPPRPVRETTQRRSYSGRQTRSTSSSTEKSPAVQTSMPVITNVQSLAPTAHTNGPSTRSSTKSVSVSTYTPEPTPPPPPPPQQPPQIKNNFIQQVVMVPPPPPKLKNKATMCKPNTHTKGVLFRPHPCHKETQTEESMAKTVLIPVPVPIYVPMPMAMYSLPFPIPTPFPLPVPIPIFIPTTRNSATGIMKEIKKIQVKIPTDPFEAELLMMAEMVAGEKKVDNTDSESDEDDAAASPGGDTGFSPEAVDTSNTFGDDMLQMALKMASELDEPAVDLEGALTANTITASQTHDGVSMTATEAEVDENQAIHHHAMMENRGAGSRGGRKRQARQARAAPTKRSRRMSGQELQMLPPPQPSAPPPPAEPIEKPDANMCLKYTFGVNAWKQWVTTKNAELEKSTRRVKPFKSEILQLTADELNYSLCLFVKEVRKPNGSEYAPDTIYYLCLGIQQYLFENGRIDNIFTDPYYEKFTECLDEVARKFSVLYNDSHYIVTRVEEEHLWESKQLGAHSPHVLLSTLMFFNTKHFNLTTVDEHMQLSFSHIMKHWKRNPNQPGAAKAPGSRNVLLRFYPPQSAIDGNARKKKVYEQQENEENPLRCPVKLYEFYLSKCPESVKTRNDVFYLLPERSCVPDSPVWYSTMALGRNALEKMLHRVKMVKEINVALLTS